jgi:hypothetical protein
MRTCYFNKHTLCDTPTTAITTELMLSSYQLVHAVQSTHTNRQRELLLLQAVVHAVQPIHTVTYNLVVAGLVILHAKWTLCFFNAYIITLQIYYTRKDSGTPKVSPKAGNMNAAIFPIDYPEQAPFIGDSTVLVVNDCR